jgi:hypothetical protein
MKASAYLYDTISDPVSASSVSPDAAPFKRAHGKALFDFYHSVSAYHTECIHRELTDCTPQARAQERERRELFKLTMRKPRLTKHFTVQRFAQGMIGLGNVTGKQMLPKGKIIQTLLMGNNH